MKYESTLQTSILNDLRSLGKQCYVRKLEKTNEAGDPDIFFTTDDTGGVFVETKRSDGVLSPKQQAALRDINTNGCYAFSCFSWEEWVDIKKTLNLVTRTVISK